jgi:hypothetical protein
VGGVSASSQAPNSSLVVSAAGVASASAWRAVALAFDRAKGSPWRARKSRAAGVRGAVSRGGDLRRALKGKSRSTRANGVGSAKARQVAAVTKCGQPAKKDRPSDEDCPHLGNPTQRQPGIALHIVNQR